VIDKIFTLTGAAVVSEIGKEAINCAKKDESNIADEDKLNFKSLEELEREAFQHKVEFSSKDRLRTRRFQRKSMFIVYASPDVAMDLSKLRKQQKKSWSSVSNTASRALASVNKYIQLLLDDPFDFRVPQSTYHGPQLPQNHEGIEFDDWVLLNDECIFLFAMISTESRVRVITYLYVKI